MEEQIYIFYYKSRYHSFHSLWHSPHLEESQPFLSTHCGLGSMALLPIFLLLVTSVSVLLQCPMSQLQAPSCSSNKCHLIIHLPYILDNCGNLYPYKLLEGRTAQSRYIACQVTHLLYPPLPHRHVVKSWESPLCYGQGADKVPLNYSVIVRCCVPM